MLGWWNGRHVRLRGVCRKAWGFKSPPSTTFLPLSWDFSRDFFPGLFRGFWFIPASSIGYAFPAPRERYFA